MSTRLPKPDEEGEMLRYRQSMTPSSTAAARWGSPAECPSIPGPLVIRSRISGTPGTRPAFDSYSTSGTTSACSGRTSAGRGPRRKRCRWTWWSFATDLQTRGHGQVFSMQHIPYRPYYCAGRHRDVRTYIYIYTHTHTRTPRRINQIGNYLQTQTGMNATQLHCQIYADQNWVGWGWERLIYADKNGAGGGGGWGGEREEGAYWNNSFKNWNRWKY